MDQIAGENRILAKRDSVMIDGVARRWDERDQVGKRVIAGDDITGFRLDDRDHAVDDLWKIGLFAFLDPKIQFLFREDVPSVRKRRNPTTVLQPRIPADVVDMK